MALSGLFPPGSDWLLRGDGWAQGVFSPSGSNLPRGGEQLLQDPGVLFVFFMELGTLLCK